MRVTVRIETYGATFEFEEEEMVRTSDRLLGLRQAQAILLRLFRRADGLLASEITRAGGDREPR